MSQDLKSLRLLAKKHGINLTNNGKYKTKAMLTNELNKKSIPVKLPVQMPTPSEIHIENDDDKGKKIIHIPPSSTGFTVNIYMTQNNQKEQKEQKEQKYESKYESKYPSAPPPSAPSPPPPPSAPPPSAVQKQPQENIETPEQKAKRLEQSEKNRQEAKIRLEATEKQAKSATDFLSSLKEATEKQKKKIEGRGMAIKKK